MNRDDYLEEEWPEESQAEPETPAEEEESDRGLYTYDTAPSEEEEDKNAKESPEEADFQNAEHFTFRLIDDHRIYKMEEPPKIESKTKWYEKAEACFQIYEPDCIRLYASVRHARTLCRSEAGSGAGSAGSGEAL